MGGDFHLTALGTSTTHYSTFPQVVEGEDRFLRSRPFTADVFHPKPIHRASVYEYYVVITFSPMSWLPRLYFRDFGNVQHEKIAFFGNKSRVSGFFKVYLSDSLDWTLLMFVCLSRLEAGLSLQTNYPSPETTMASIEKEHCLVERNRLFFPYLFRRDMIILRRLQALGIIQVKDSPKWYRPF